MNSSREHSCGEIITLALMLHSMYEGDQAVRSYPCFDDGTVTMLHLAWTQAWGFTHGFSRHVRIDQGISSHDDSV